MPKHHDEKSNSKRDKIKSKGHKGPNEKIRVQDGSIVFGSKAKMSKWGVLGLCVFVAIIIYFIVFVPMGMQDADAAPGDCVGWTDGRCVAREAGFPQSHIDIAIYKSKSCTASIVAGGDCLSYEKLVPIFDNTNQVISGAFYYDPITKDLKRSAPRMSDHWNYYEFAGMRYILAVAPDNKWAQRAVDIEIVIEPSTNFVYLDDDRDVEVVRANALPANATMKKCTAYKGFLCVAYEMVPFQETTKNCIGWTDGECVEWEEIPLREIGLHENNILTEYDDVYVKGCTFARVSSDETMVLKVLNYFLRECLGTHQINAGGEPLWFPDDQKREIVLRALPVNPSDSDNWKYNQWMNKKLVECKERC